MSMLSASELAYTHAAHGAPIFEHVSFDVHPGDRIALVGPNGAGKTTLLHLLTGAREPQAGRIVRRAGLKLASVAQVPDVPDGMSLLDVALSGDPAVAGARAALAGDPDEPSYLAALTTWEALDGWALEARAVRVLAGLGLPAALHDEPFHVRSSGQQARGLLAAALVQPADLVLLDEPTNHLDDAGRAWLEAWLRREPAAVLLVSHDRAFLEATAQRTFALAKGSLAVHEGGYHFWRDAEALASEHAWAAYEGQQRRHAAAERAAELRLSLARQVAAPPSGPGLGAQDFYNAKAKRVDKTAAVIRARAAREPEAPKPVLDPRIPAFDWPEPAHAQAAVPLAARGLAKAFGGRTLFRDLTFDLARGERLALVGPNGAGKTTLVRLLLGLLPPDAGEVVVAPRAKVGWFGQAAEQLDPEASALDNALAEGGEPARARLLLACLRLRGERVFEPVGRLSAGERAVVALARLLLAGPDVLLLDEPTNHLDLPAREAMEATLAGYPGAIVLVSHDQHLVEALADRRLALDGNGGWTMA